MHKDIVRPKLFFRRKEIYSVCDLKSLAVAEGPRNKKKGETIINCMSRGPQLAREG